MLNEAQFIPSRLGDGIERVLLRRARRLVQKAEALRDCRRADSPLKSLPEAEFLMIQSTNKLEVLNSGMQCTVIEVVILTVGRNIRGMHIKQPCHTQLYFELKLDAKIVD